MTTWNDFDEFIRSDAQEISHEASMYQPQEVLPKGHVRSIFPAAVESPFTDTHGTADISIGESTQTGHWSQFDQQEEAETLAYSTSVMNEDDDLYLRMKQVLKSQEGGEVSPPAPEKQSPDGEYVSETQTSYVPNLSTPLAEVAITHGDVGDPDSQTESDSIEQKRATLQRINDVLCMMIGKHWYPGVYHHDIRAEIIKKNPPERYTHDPEKGDTALDVTSFWKPHRDWGFASRQDRPTVLQEWRPKFTAMKVPDYWKHNGSIVLDSAGHPIRDWPMPGCLSSQVEAGRCEAIVRESGHKITNHDLIARMPWIPGSDGSWKPPITDGGLSMRRNRFRDISGLPSTNPRMGSTEKKLALIQIIPAAIMEDILLTNSMQGFRDLNREEVKFLEKSTRGLHPKKAGSKLGEPEERKKAKDSREKSLINFKPVNPTSEPFGTDPDDGRALERLRRRRELAHLNASQNNILHQGNHKELPGSASPSFKHGSTTSQSLQGLESSDYGSFEATSEIHEIGRKRRRGEECENSEASAVVSKKIRRSAGKDAQLDVLEVVSSQGQGEPKATSQTMSGGTPYVFGSTYQNDNPQLALAPSNTADGLSDHSNPRIATVTAEGTPFLASFESTKVADDDILQYHMLGPDYRFKAPSNDDEASTIASCIQFTELEIEEKLGVRPPTWHGLSYMEHWDLLRVWFAHNWFTNDAPALWRDSEPWFVWPHEL
ncbi:MAG: hypothetical protein Q9223_004385 [Gallowayella weberi]